MSVPKRYSGRPTRRGPLRPKRLPAQLIEAEPAPEPVVEVVPPAPEPFEEPEVTEPVIEVTPEPTKDEESEDEEVSDSVEWKASMKKVELLDIAGNLGLDVSDSNTKAEILDALNGTRD